MILNMSSNITYRSVPSLGPEQLLQVVGAVRREQRLEEAGGLLDRRPPRRRAQPRVLVIAVRTVRRAVTQILTRRYKYVDIWM